LSKLTRQLRPGDTVHRCRDPDEALRIAEKHGCDLLPTEVEIGSNRDGLMLAEMLRERNPQMEVICVTHCRDNLTALRAWRIHARGYLPKPYTPQELAEELDCLSI
jgi:DNA-binding NarL/FixJ family response regulator